MVTNKRAQIFLLAAVIISMVVLSLGVTMNRAVVAREPEEFYDFSYEVKKESSAALDYEIYTNLDGNLENFVASLIDSIEEREPNANFIIIYGNNVDGIKIKNKRDEVVVVGETEINGGGKVIKSKVCHGSFCEDVEEVATDYDEDAGEGVISGEDLGDDSEIVVEVNEQEFEFPIFEYSQVIFIIQKDVEDEVYIAVG